MLRLLLLALPIIYIPNALRFSAETGIPGLNIANLLLVMVVLALLFGARASAPTTARGYLTAPLMTFFAALAVALVIALMTKPMDQVADLTYFKDALFYPLFYLVYRRFPLEARERRILVILILVVAVIAALQAVRQGIDYGLGHYSDANRASGPFGTDWSASNRAGPFYAMFLPLFIALALQVKNRTMWRLAALGACAVLGLAIMFTYSRQSYFIALAALAFLVLRKNLIFAGIIGLALVASVDLLPNSVTQRVEKTEQRNAVGEETFDDSTASRFIIWQGAAQMWSEHPFGVGLNRFKSYIGQYSSYHGYDAHNFYVLTLAETGPLGLLALLWLLWRMLVLGQAFKRSWRTLDDETRALSIGFNVTVVAMALGNVYGSRFLDGAIMVNFWILCALVEGFVGNDKSAASAAASADVPIAVDMADRFPLAARSLPGRQRKSP